jgi:hypothetical protein
MTTNERRFAAFILTHGRADRVYTYNTLRKHGYTGKIYLLCDNEDEQLEEYRERYGDSVIVFDKQEAINITDSGDNFKKRNSVVYARNYNFKVAAELGLTHFWQLDDDYTRFEYRADNNNEYIYKYTPITMLDEILSAMCDFLDESGAYSIAMAQGGDYIGGDEGRFAKLIKKGKFHRKVMNTFLFRVDRPVKFMGRINEDVNMYVEWGRRGYLFVTIPQLSINQKVTQTNPGGLTDIYLDVGTYVKSFYTVMYAPSCVRIRDIGYTDKRIHHEVLWRYAVPAILDEKYCKRKARQHDNINAN